MDFGNMRDFSEFCEQLCEIRTKFHKWDSCERTVALYYLMVGLPFANARFLQYALEQCIVAAQTKEALTLEKNANDPSYISSFLSERPQIALSLLLTHLPLLKPGNRDGVNSYLKTIQKVLTEFLTPPYKIYNECVEIMSYVFIHPAFNKEDKKNFKSLLKHVLNRVSPDNFIHSPVNDSSDESVSPNPELINLNKRSNSLTPGALLSEKTSSNFDNWSSQENVEKPAHQKQRSFSFSSENSLLTSIHPIGYELKPKDTQFLSTLPIMKNIISWLKSLRLHKYSWLFHNLTYDQMMELTDDTLQAIGITKGARHKLLLSIKKLKERSSLLTELETEIMNGVDLNVALKKIKTILQSPLPTLDISGEDLSPQIMKVMGKVCTQLLMLRQPSDELLLQFNSLCERAESLEAFTEEQKKRLAMWKTQLTNGTNNLPVYNQRHSNTHSRNHKILFSSTIQRPAYAQKSSSFPNMQVNPSAKTHRHSVGSETLKSQLFGAPSGRTHKDSYPSAKTHNGNPFHHVRFRDSDYTNSSDKRDQKNVDIESSLESLCIQMMEHALGP